MNNIPPDIYERVHELALALTNATEADDSALYDSLYQTLLDFYHDQTRQGRVHPFLTEALADYTDDAAISAQYYELALKQSGMFPGEPTHTKMISLAERLIELGQIERAEACLRDGRAEAVRRGDSYWIEDASRLLAQCAA